MQLVVNNSGSMQISLLANGIFGERFAPNKTHTVLVGLNSRRLNCLSRTNGICCLEADDDLQGKRTHPSDLLSCHVCNT